MVRHHLDASRIENTVDGFSIFWEDGFNKTHGAKIVCFNSGFVMGCIIDNKERTSKGWIIPELSTSDADDLNRKAFSLSLSADESLEYIRHYIWANHTV